MMMMMIMVGLATMKLDDRLRERPIRNDCCLKASVLKGREIVDLVYYGQ
jgi:hypothetical protein